MNKPWKTLLILCLGLLLIMTGCSQTTSTDGGNKDKIIVDSLGREVTLTSTPQRVISLSPAITEIFYALELEDYLVGTTTFCNFPQDALDKPKVGGFSNPNMELIVESQGEMVFVAAGVQLDLIGRLEDLGLQVVCIDAQKVDEVIDNIKLIGEIMGVPEKGKRLATHLEDRKNGVWEKVKDLEKPLVFFEIWDDPLMSVGPGTFIDDLIRLAGGANLAGDNNPGYFQLSLEVLFHEDPDVYMAINHYKPTEISGRQGYTQLNAVKAGRVYTIEDDWVTLPGPRIILGLEEMAFLLHPEAFQ